jgi:hypothetical protein
LFEQHAHAQVFDGGETKAERERWLREVEEICQEAGVEYVVREIDRDGNPGYEFGFADVTHYTAFVLNVYGDLEGPGQHTHTHVHTDLDPVYQDAFRRAAEMHLRELGINYDCEQDGNEVCFKFDRFSDRMMFKALVEQGTLDASARGLASIRSCQSAIGLHPETSFWPGLDFN